MPGRCGRRWAAACNEIETTTDGLKMHTWRAVRRQNLRKMRKEVMQIILLMAFMDIIRVGPLKIKQEYSAPGPEDFGISYNLGHFLSWLRLCVFTVIFTILYMTLYVPLFSWWVSKPSVDSNESAEHSTCAIIWMVFEKMSSILFPFAIGLCLVHYLFHLIEAFIYVDAREVGSRKLPKNTRKNWLVRLMLLGGVLVSLGSGFGIFRIWASTNLAHVKLVEYLVIVVPIQINVGILLGSIVQLKVEKRNARKQLHAKAVETEAAITSDEKQVLLEL